MATQKKKATIVAKKSLVKKPIAKKADSHSKKSGAVKKITSKKAVSAKKATPKKTAKTAKPIVKSALAKKSAKPVAKKAAPKKLSTNTKKSEVKKPVASVKKSVTASKKVTPNKTKTSESKSANTLIAKNHSVAANTEHKKELKKALTVKKQLVSKPQKPFVMPKTNTEKARKYEPQFVKSVLDQAPEENNGPTMRYSDNELNEFKDLISRKLETAKKELGYLQGLITRKDEMGGDDTDNRYMTMEDGSLSMEREQLSQMASRQITFIDHLEKAMMRIENKTYGICRVTGKLIDKARLRAVPHATLSIEAKMGIAK